MKLLIKISNSFNRNFNLKSSIKSICCCIHYTNTCANTCQIKLLYILAVTSPKELSGFISDKLDDICNIVESYQGDYLSFLLKPLLIAGIPLKQKILKVLRENFKNIGRGEHEIIAHIFGSVLSGKDTSKVKIREKGEASVELLLTLSSSELKGVVKRNIQKIALTGIGLWSAGYDRVYTLPFDEKENYFKYIKYEFEEDPHYKIIHWPTVEEICEKLATEKYRLTLLISILSFIITISLGIIIYYLTPVVYVAPIPTLILVMVLILELSLIHI